MNAKTRTIIALSIILVFGLGLTYVRFSNFSISADSIDQATLGQSSFCTVQISGKIQLTHIEKNSYLNLMLVDGSQTLAKTSPINDKYSFSISGKTPNDNWSILATENLNGQQLQYPVVSLGQIKCDSTNQVDLQF